MNKFLRFLNSDRYQYTESEVYLKSNMQNQTAVFDVFLRTEKKNDYGIVYGIADILELIDIFNKTSYEEKKKYLSKIIHDKNLSEYIANMQFTGSIKGVRDGEIVFSNEPILTITVPLIIGKIMETPILNILNYRTLTATVTSKIVQASENRGVLFFGTRRVAGFEASLAMTKATYMAGCISHSNVVGEYLYNILSTGTMTHAYIQSFGMGKEGEYKAFSTFIKNCKGNKAPLIMLVDTYSTLESGILNAVNAFKDNGINDNYESIYGIRIDSGDLCKLSKECRKILNENGFFKGKIILTGGLDEIKIKELIENGGEADMFGVGDSIALPEKEISAVYKMTKIGSSDVMKISDDKKKTSNPGNKNLYRIYEKDDFFDIITLENDNIELKIKNEKKGKKLTVDYIIDGEKKDESYALLELEKSKKYYDKNLSYLKKIYNEKERKNRVRLSEELEKLKNKLLEK